MALAGCYCTHPGCLVALKNIYFFMITTASTSTRSISIFPVVWLQYPIWYSFLSPGFSIRQLTLKNGRPVHRRAPGEDISHRKWTLTCQCHYRLVRHVLWKHSTEHQEDARPGCLQLLLKLLMILRQCQWNIDLSCGGSFWLPLLFSSLWSIRWSFSGFIQWWNSCSCFSFRWW